MFFFPIGLPVENSFSLVHLLLHKYKVKKVDVKDTSGAGDSFMAALVVNYLNTNNIDQAIKYANECASEVVKHRGVSLI